jgi:hypothetical protein
MNRAAGSVLTLLLLILAALIPGCATKAKVNADQQAAFLAGQNALLQQQQAQKFPTVTILGPVHSHTVPWVAGLTLAQAVATADYLGSRAPTEIIITAHAGDSATLDGAVLLNGPAVPLEAGDVVEIRY